MPFLVLLGMLPTVARVAQSQNDPPLNFVNNFFVTGDYVVAGAYGITSNFKTINGISYAVGTINVPDANNKGVPNPGITGATSVPPGAEIVSALLYWQTVEKVGVPPGTNGSGQNGYFLPLANAGSFPKGFLGYPISGANVSGSNTVSWSSGGCTGTSTGKVLKTYRADVGGGLPVDKYGNSEANTSFQVLLPSAGNGTPITLGATLVVIYRIPSGAGGPNIPLNSIVILDGDYAQGNADLTMTQSMPGPYGPIDADVNTITRLTHIVGNGKSNKFQTVYLGPDANHLTRLPSLYGKNLPAFPGYYGSWDNVTWTFPSGSPLGVSGGDTTGATTQVVPAPSMQGCVSWGAVIMSSTVNAPDGDGIPESWKNQDGYCDYLSNASCSGPGDVAWISLLDPKVGEKDIYLHYDYLCSKVTGKNSCARSSVQASLSAVGAASGATATYTGTFSPTIPAGTLVTIGGFKNLVNNGQFFVASSTSTQLVVNNANAIAEKTSATATYGDYSFDPTLAIDPLDGKNAVQKVIDAFDNHTGSPGTEPFVLHVERGNAIQENQTSCADTDTDANGNLTCIFPNEPGTVGFREGLAWIKNSTIDTGMGLLDGCDPSSDPNCVGFQHGKKDSYHYALFSHGVGLASWFLSDGSLQPVSQSGSTVTFTTKSPHGLMPIAGDSVCSKANGYIGRVTVIFAITNPNLNGTFCAKPVGNPPAANEFAITIKALLPGTTLSSYTVNTDPNLSVADGNVTSMSGYSDLGGQNSVISLGEGGWAPVQNFNPPSEGNKWNVVAGTFMHELGHTLGLTHGGSFLDNYKPSANPPVIDYTPTYEVNCKPNVQTVMSYLFQFDLLQTPGPGNQPPVKALDYSEDPPVADSDLIPTLTEGSGGGIGILDKLTYPYTSWFVPSAEPLPSNHCDGSPTVTGENSYIYTNQPIGDFTFSAGQDINFNGTTTDTMHPHNEWEGTPGAADGSAGLSSGVDLQQVSAAGTVSAIGPGGEAGGLKPSGTGGGLKPAGTGGGLKPAGTGGAGFTPAGGGGGFKPAGTGGASFEITHNQASSYPRPPQNLFINQEEASPRLIDLDWFAASFGTAVQYNIYQSTDGGQTFTKIASVPGSQTSYQATVTCNLTGYQYRITAVTISDSGTQIESSPSNTVPAPGEPLLTGCYLVDPSNGQSNFTVPASGTQGSDVSFSFTLVDDFIIVNPGDTWNHAAQNGLSTLSSGKLFVNGPAPSANCTTTPATAHTLVGTITNGVAAVQETNDSFSGTGNSYSFTWSNINTDNRCSGVYTFELDLDSGQVITSSNLALGIDINDQDTPRITTLSLPDATADVAYNPPALSEDGGVGAITWSVPGGGLPTGITLNPATGAFSGFTTTAGTYTFTVQATDSKGNKGTQAFKLVVHIFVSATPLAGSAPFIASTALQDATVGVMYNQAVTGLGGTGALTWAITGSYPSSISQQGSSATISGTTCAVGAGLYNLSASVLDSASPQNNGMHALTLQVDKGSTMTTVSAGPNQNPSVFQQSVTFTVTVASQPQSTCVPTGNVTLYIDGVQFGSAEALDNTGRATFGPVSNLSVNTLANPTHSITASYLGDTNFNGSTSAVYSQTVNPAFTSTSLVSVSPSTAFVGNPITVSYTFGVVAPGAGSPIAPTGSITVSATDNAVPTPHTSSCVVVGAPYLALGGGMCTLSPAPPVAGNYTFTINYPGDGNFVTSGANGGYAVYQLVFATQPTNTGVGNTITPAVQVTAEDSSNNPLTSFTGGVTMAIGAGPGTLSGTTTKSAVAGVATFNDLSINQVASGYTLTAAPAGGVPSVTSSAFDIDTFYVDSNGNFGTLDLRTGTVTQIAAGTVPGSNGIDLDGLQVYTYNSSNQLMQITPSTGAATAIGSPGSIPPGDQVTSGALTDGTYFAIDALTGILYSINLTTGATTSLGNTSTATALPSGCGFETSLSGLAGSPGVLYYTIGYAGPSCTSPTPDTLYQINPTSGTATPIGPITIGASPANGFVGSALVGGTLYAFTSGGQIYSIAPSTGVATLLVSTTPTTSIFGAGSSQ